MDDLTSKYIGEDVDIWLANGESHDGRLSAFCTVGGLPHVELDGHIIIPLQNVVGLHCTSRCDTPGLDWPPNLSDEEPEIER